MRVPGAEHRKRGKRALEKFAFLPFSRRRRKKRGTGESGRLTLSILEERKRRGKGLKRPIDEFFR